MAGRKRYLVEWSPWEAVKAAAIESGWTEADSVADFVTISDFDKQRVFPRFDLAVQFAKDVLPADTWGCPLIRRQFIAPNDRDDLGRNVEPMPAWETEANWEVGATETEYAESAPDWLEAAG